MSITYQYYENKYTTVPVDDNLVCYIPLHDINDTEDKCGNFSMGRIYTNIYETSYMYSTKYPSKKTFNNLRDDPTGICIEANGGTSSRGELYFHNNQDPHYKYDSFVIKKSFFYVSAFISFASYADSNYYNALLIKNRNCITRVYHRGGYSSTRDIADYDDRNGSTYNVLKSASQAVFVSNDNLASLNNNWSTIAFIKYNNHKFGCYISNTGNNKSFFGSYDTLVSTTMISNANSKYLYNNSITHSGNGRPFSIWRDCSAEGSNQYMNAIRDIRIYKNITDYTYDNLNFYEKIEKKLVSINGEELNPKTKRVVYDDDEFNKKRLRCYEYR